MPLQLQVQAITLKLQNGQHRQSFKSFVSLRLVFTKTSFAFVLVLCILYFGFISLNVGSGDETQKLQHSR